MGIGQEQKHKRFAKTKKSLTICIFVLALSQSTPPLRRCVRHAARCRENNFIFINDENKIIFCKNFYEIFTYFFLIKKNNEKSDFYEIFIEILLRTFFLRKKNKKMSN